MEKRACLAGSDNRNEAIYSSEILRSNRNENVTLHSRMRLSYLSLFSFIVPRISPTHVFIEPLETGFFHPEKPRNVFSPSAPEGSRFTLVLTTAAGSNLIFFLFFQPGLLLPVFVGEAVQGRVRTAASRSD